MALPPKTADEAPMALFLYPPVATAMDPAALFRDPPEARIQSLPKTCDDVFLSAVHGHARAAFVH